MKLSKIIAFLEEKFPLKMAEEWDNVGLLVGKRDREIEKILLTVDVTNEIIDFAISENINLILSHHPIIFKPLKSVTGDTKLGEKILRLIENKIAVYSMHTNLDSQKGGLNDFLGENILGFSNGKIIDEADLNGNNFGIGRFYKLDKEKTIKEFAQEIKDRLNLESISLVTSDENKVIKKVALINGAGASYWRKAKKIGADILITGDVKYHDALDCLEENFNILDVGHLESEIFFINLLEDILKNEFELEILIKQKSKIFKNI